MFTKLRRLLSRKPETPIQSRRVFTVYADYPTFRISCLPYPEGKPIQCCFSKEYDPYRNCIVSAPTGTGKSGVIWTAADVLLKEGKAVIVIEPARALIREIYNEGVAIFGDSLVGKYSGRDRDTEGKSLIICTQEGYLAARRAGKEWVKASLMVVDEAHNIFDPQRGKDLDTAITCHQMDGGRVLFASATIPHMEKLVEAFDADLFKAEYSTTKITTVALTVPNDLQAQPIPQKSSKEKGEDSYLKELGDLRARHGKGNTRKVQYLRAHSFNPESQRLKELREILARHKEDSVLIFVPLKLDGFVLQEILGIPFHCKDVDEEAKNRYVADFNAGRLKALIATNTLSQGVNTPCDVVVIYGTRRGKRFLDMMDVGQMKGRAGRGRETSLVYHLGDQLEHFHAAKYTVGHSTVLPVESMLLTVLAQQVASVREITEKLGQTFAASFCSEQKVQNEVQKGLAILKEYGLLVEKAEGVTLSQEGYLVARYCVAPKIYVEYKRITKLLETSAFTDLERGAVLMTLILPELFAECPPRIEKDLKMKLIALELEHDLSSHRVGAFIHFLGKPTAMPEHFPWVFSDYARWDLLLRDLEKFQVFPEGAPGFKWLRLMAQGLRSSIEKAAQAKKPVPGMPLPTPKEKLRAVGDGS